MIRTVLMCLLLGSLVVSCALPVNDQDWLAESQVAANSLHQDLSKMHQQGHLKVLVVSFVNIDDLTQTTTFGRMQAEMLANQLAKNGLEIIDVRLRKTMYIKQKQGEFFLSRDVQKLGKKFQADVVLTGNYAIGLDQVYVSAKLVSPHDNGVWAAHSWALNKGPNLMSLLKQP